MCVCECECVCLSICYLNALHFWPPLDATPRRPPPACPAVNFRQEFSQHFRSDHRMWISTTTSISRLELTQFHVRWQRQSRNAGHKQTWRCGLFGSKFGRFKVRLNRHFQLNFEILSNSFQKQFVLFYQPHSCASPTLTTLAALTI